MNCPTLLPLFSSLSWILDFIPAHTCNHWNFNITYRSIATHPSTYNFHLYVLSGQTLGESEFSYPRTEQNEIKSLRKSLTFLKDNQSKCPLDKTPPTKCTPHSMQKIICSGKKTTSPKEKMAACIFVILKKHCTVGFSIQGSLLFQVKIPSSILSRTFFLGAFWPTCAFFWRNCFIIWTHWRNY